MPGLGFVAGALGCTAGCTFDMSACASCGNGVLDGAEECDGPDLGGQTCQGLGFSGGTLACSPGCEHDTSGCST